MEENVSLFDTRTRNYIDVNHKTTKTFGCVGVLMPLPSSVSSSSAVLLIQNLLEIKILALPCSIDLKHS